MRIVVTVALIIGACSSRAQPPPAPPPPIDAAPSIDAPELRAALPPVRAAVRAWQLDPSVALPASVMGPAVAALVAWDRPGATFTVPCRPIEDLDEFPAVNAIAEAAIDASSGLDDPRLHAALALAAALRRPEQPPTAIEIGVGIAAHAARRHLAFADLAPEPDVVERVARAEARCNLEIAARDLADRSRWPTIARHRTELRLAPAHDLVADELAGQRAFCDETVARALAARDHTDLEILADERSLASIQHPPAAVANWYACDLLGVHHLVSDLDAYAAASP